jgi:hypothetical protein
MLFVKAITVKKLRIERIPVSDDEHQVSRLHHETLLVSVRYQEQWDQLTF